MGNDFQSFLHRFSDAVNAERVDRLEPRVTTLESMGLRHEVEIDKLTKAYDADVEPMNDLGRRVVAIEQGYATLNVYLLDRLTKLEETVAEMRQRDASITYDLPDLVDATPPPKPHWSSWATAERANARVELLTSEELTTLAPFAQALKTIFNMVGITQAAVSLTVEQANILRRLLAVPE